MVYLGGVLGLLGHKERTFDHSPRHMSLAATKASGHTKTCCSVLSRVAIPPPLTPGQAIRAKRTIFSGFGADDVCGVLP